jgi:uncharacterized membrane protein YtjA (UPF0391 family)
MSLRGTLIFAAIIFLLIAVVAYLIGWFGLFGLAWGLVWLIVGIFVILFVISLIAAWLRSH